MSSRHLSNLYFCSLRSEVGVSQCWEGVKNIGSMPSSIHVFQVQSADSCCWRVHRSPEWTAQFEIQYCCQFKTSLECEDFLDMQRLPLKSASRQFNNRKVAHPQHSALLRWSNLSATFVVHVRELESREKAEVIASEGIGRKPKRCLVLLSGVKLSRRKTKHRIRKMKNADHHNKPFNVIVFGEAGVGKSGKSIIWFIVYPPKTQFLA